MDDCGDGGDMFDLELAEENEDWIGDDERHG